MSTNDERLFLYYELLSQEIRLLRDRLQELGADMSRLDDVTLSEASHSDLRLWKHDFERLIRTLSAGGRE